MNKYLMKIYKYFTGYEEFTIEAENMNDAIVRAVAFVRKEVKDCSGDYNLKDVRYIRKLQCGKYNG